MKTHLLLSWSDFLNVIHSGGVGYPFVIWLFLIIILVGNYLWRTSTNALPWTRFLFIGLAFASCITLVFGVWFWIFGSGGGNQIRYFMPFLLMAIILATPLILTAVQAMQSWKILVLSTIMIAPIINLGMLLPQHNPTVEWQGWTGVNLTSSSVPDPVLIQAQNFVRVANHESHSIILYSMSFSFADSIFQSVIDHANFTNPTIPIRVVFRPIDWQRPSTFRKDEMLAANYWLIEPVRDPHIVQATLATSSIDNLNQEVALFQAWATQLTENEGVTIVSDIPMARVLHITNKALLESAFDSLVAKHHWSETFVTANQKR